VKNYYREIVFGIALSIIFAGLLFWFAINEPKDLLTIGIAIITFLLGIVTFIWQNINKKRDIKAGAPSEDEFTKLAKVYAGNRAFLYSMYLWLLIFIFNSSFTKNETMLGIGILGSALIYGISLWYFKTTGEFNEK
jgi:ABC-type uncharacterized transport system permease subunit